MVFTKSAAPVVELTCDPGSHLEPLVPLSVLQLDLDTPAEGWPNFLAARDIEVTLDDIGRMAISRDAARQLLTEKREREAERARRRKLVEAQAVADDPEFGVVHRRWKACRLRL
jgi:hypothetical protein